MEKHVEWGHIPIEENCLNAWGKYYSELGTIFYSQDRNVVACPKFYLDKEFKGEKWIHYGKDYQITTKERAIQIAKRHCRREAKRVCLAIQKIIGEQNNDRTD
jgi:hypothetical protein